MTDRIAWTALTGIIFIIIGYALYSLSKPAKLIEVTHTHPNPTHTHTAYIRADSTWYPSGLPVRDWENITINDTLP